MTREEAIKICKNIDASAEIRFKHPEVEEAFNMAIQALEQEPVIDKIKAEIEHMACRQYEYKLMLDREDVLKVLDKYKEEME